MLYYQDVQQIKLLDTESPSPLSHSNLGLTCWTLITQLAGFRFSSCSETWLRDQALLRSRNGMPLWVWLSPEAMGKQSSPSFLCFPQLEPRTWRFYFDCVNADITFMSPPAPTVVEPEDRRNLLPVNCPAEFLTNT